MISTAYANVGSFASNELLGLLPMLVIMALFWLLLIRPQRKQQQKLLAELAVGDEIMTHSGIYAKVTAIEENFIRVLIAKNVEIQLQKQAIAAKLATGTVSL
jgi:preprotein translocase subunit YajC